MRRIFILAALSLPLAVGLTHSASWGFASTLIRYVQWWDHGDFASDVKRLAAELVASTFSTRRFAVERGSEPSH